MSSLFGGGGSSKNAGNPGGGYYLTGGGANAPFEMGPTPFDISSIASAVDSNQQAIMNRYDQLGLGGATESSPATTSTPTTTTTTTPTATGSSSIGDLALQAINALGGNLPEFAKTPGFANLFFGIPGPLLSGTGASGSTATPTSASSATDPTSGGSFSGGSTMEQQDLAGAGQQGTALLGQEQTADVTQPALNPALQPPINSLVGVQSGQSNQSGNAANALGTAIGAGGQLLSGLGGSSVGGTLADVATGALALGLP